MGVDLNIGQYIAQLLNIIIDIIEKVFDHLDRIYIAENVSMLSILVFLLIISAIIPIIMTIPQTSKLMIRREKRRK